MESTRPENLALLTGPQLFGHLFNWGLFGALTVQVYTYIVSFPNDPRFLKAYVYTLFAIECVQVGMSSRDAYAVLGIGWGDQKALDSNQLLWFDIPVLSGIMSGAVQSFFAWRIYILSGSIYLGVFIGLIALMQASGAMATGITIGLNAIEDGGIQEETAAECTVWLAGSAICDIIIAGCMLYYLSKGRQGLASDALISRLMRMTVETGALTASVACVDLVLFLTFKHNNLHMTPALVLSKLYSNSLLMIFNNRTQLRNLRGGVQASGGRIYVTTRSEVTTDRVPGSSREISLTKFTSARREDAHTDYEDPTKSVAHGDLAV